jgi:hypothetical protein
MQVRVDRDSVCAGDDVEAHDRILAVPDTGTLEGLTSSVLRVFDLPRIQGGRATWCLTSRRPVAVVAQEWSAPRMVPWQSRPISDCKMVDGVVRLHFNYLAQVDPEIVLQVLQRLRLED